MKSIWNIRKRLLGALVLVAFALALLAPCVAEAKACCNADITAVSYDLTASGDSQKADADTDHCAYHCGVQVVGHAEKTMTHFYQKQLTFALTESDAPSNYLLGLLRPPQA